MRVVLSALFQNSIIANDTLTFVYNFGSRSLKEFVIFISAERSLSVQQQDREDRTPEGRTSTPGTKTIKHFLPLLMAPEIRNSTNYFDDGDYKSLQQHL